MKIEKELVEEVKYRSEVDAFSVHRNSEKLNVSGPGAS